MAVTAIKGVTLTSDLSIADKVSSIVSTTELSEVSQTLSTSRTITAGRNAIAMGTYKIAAAATLTIPAGSFLVVI